MKNVLRIFLAMALLVTFAAGGAAQSKKFTVKDLPKPVKAAFTASYPKAAIKGVDKEDEKGVTYYEIESVDGKMKRDLLYTADGKVFEIEEGLSADALPTDVSKALAKEHPGYSFVKGEKVVRGSDVTFSVKYKSGKKTYKSTVTQQGKVTATKEVKKSKKEKEEKEDKED
jgi:hypothetical protein